MTMQASCSMCTVLIPAIKTCQLNFLNHATDNATDTQNFFLLCANFRGVTSTFTAMTPLDVTGMENILGRLSKVILLNWYLIIILLNKILIC